MNACAPRSTLLALGLGDPLRTVTCLVGVCISHELVNTLFNAEWLHLAVAE